MRNTSARRGRQSLRKARKMRFSPFWLNIKMPDNILKMGREKDGGGGKRTWSGVDVGELLREKWPRPDRRGRLQPRELELSSPEVYYLASSLLTRRQMVLALKSVIPPIFLFPIQENSKGRVLLNNRTFF